MIKNRKSSARRIAYAAMLVALDIVLSRFCSINTTALKIGFAFVPIVVAANLFGPVTAAVVYAIADFIGAVLFPIGPYHPGFTLCAALMGFVYGLFLYEPVGEGRGKYIKWKKIKLFPNVIVPSLVNNLVFGLLINTKWVSMLYGSKTYMGWLVLRLSEYLLLIPLNIILIPVLLKLCGEIRKIIAVKDGRKA